MSGQMTVTGSGSQITVTPSEGTAFVSEGQSKSTLEARSVGVQGPSGVSQISQDPNNEITEQGGIFAPRTADFDPGDLALYFNSI